MSELELSVIAHFIITKWESIDAMLFWKIIRNRWKNCSEKGTLAWEAGIDSF